MKKRYFSILFSFVLIIFVFSFFIFGFYKAGNVYGVVGTLDIQGTAGTFTFPGNGTWSAAGLVGIGHDQELTATLNVSSINGGPILSLLNDQKGEIINIDNGGSLQLSGAGADIKFTGTGPNFISTGNNINLGIMPGGNVGIGTTVPGSRFEITPPNVSIKSNIATLRVNEITQGVNGSFSPYYSVDIYPSTLYSLSIFGVSETATAYIEGPVSGNSGGVGITRSSGLKIGTNVLANVAAGYGLIVEPPTGATNNYAAAFTGNVGIGTTAPAADLHILNSNTSGTILDVDPGTITTPGTSTFYGIDLNFTNVTTSTFDVVYAINISGPANSTGNNRGINITGTNLDYGIYSDAPVSFAAGTTIGNAVGDTLSFAAGAWTSINSITWNIAAGTAALNIESGLLNLDTSNVFVESNGGILSSNATKGIGYAAGAGGAVVQSTSKSTGVTLNKISGKITMSNAALAAGAEVAFVVTNSTVAATDTVIVNIQSVGTAGSYLVGVAAVGAGSFTVVLSNMSTGSLSQAVVLNFVVIKGVAS